MAQDPEVVYLDPLCLGHRGVRAIYPETIVSLSSSETSLLP